LINGVLVERTVEQVVPALKTNQEGLKKVLDDMVKQYKTKQDELEKWKVSDVILPAVAQPANILIEEAQCSGSPSIRDCVGSQPTIAHVLG
jgi:prefoldin subunit 2